MQCGVLVERTGAAAVSFVLSGDGSASGALERLALWPVFIGLAGFAWTQLRAEGRTVPLSRTSRPHHGGS